MFRSSLICAVVLSVASVAQAQTAADPPVTPDVNRQVEGFENALRKAIEQAGGRVGERARQVVPDIVLSFEAQPYVKGYVLPTGEGMFFVVEVPAIEATSAMLFTRYRQLYEQGNPNLPRVGNTPPPTAGPPPAGAAGVPPSAGTMTNPVKEYSEFTRQGLVDTMLDFAFALPLKESQSLTLSVGVGAGPINPLEPVPRRLWLTLKAEDLVALRQNRITRDEAKTRIIERRY